MCTALLCLAKCLHNFIFCEATVKIWLYQINATKGIERAGRKSSWVSPGSVDSIVRKEAARGGKA